MRYIQLSNGLIMLFYPISNAYSTSISLYSKCGSIYDPLDKFGMTHLMEHLRFRQLTGMDQHDIYEKMEQMGLSANIYSSVDLYAQGAIFSISFSIAKQNVYAGLTAIVELLNHLKEWLIPDILKTNLPFLRKIFGFGWRIPSC